MKVLVIYGGVNKGLKLELVKELKNSKEISVNYLKP